MKDKRMLMRVPVLAVAIVMALLLLAGTYSVIASPTLSVGPGPDLPSAPSGTVFWTSPWEPITRGHTLSFNHNLGRNPETYAVELLFLDTDGGLGINRRYYGGLISGTQRYGAHWQNLTANTIQVYRQPDDNVADRVRIQVWVPPTASDYDSGWRDISQDETLTLTHGLGIPATDLTVGLWFSSTDRGIHHFAYGGMSVNPLSGTLGAYWHNLTNNTVWVTRFISDTAVEQVRVVVTQGEPPAYDSGWRSIATDTATVFTHSLNWDADMLLVRGECLMPGGLGIHQQFAGGNHFWSGAWQGTNLQNLTSNTVTIFRQPDDLTCPQARVRIWKRSLLVYLPLVMRD